LLESDLAEKIMSRIPSLQELLEAGVHFGHQARRWNPKMKGYIFGQQAGIHVIDLEKTAAQLKKAGEFIKEVASRGGVVIFLATKKQAAEIVKTEAQRVGAMYLTKRWLGGLLTNFDSVKKTIEKAGILEEKLKNAESTGYTKKEQLLIRRDLDKLNRLLGGIRGLNKLPDCLFIVDAHKEDNAVAEAGRMGVPIVALVDTNGDPTLVTYPIAANDDALKSISILVKTIADAYGEGRGIWDKKSAEKTETESETAKKTKLAVQTK